MQVSVVQDAFTPTAAQIEYAVALEAAFIAHAAKGVGAFSFQVHPWGWGGGYGCVWGGCVLREHVR